MNIVVCTEECSHQKDGCCMLEDLTLPCGDPAAPCKYFCRRQRG